MPLPQCSPLSRLLPAPSDLLHSPSSPPCPRSVALDHVSDGYLRPSPRRTPELASSAGSPSPRISGVLTYRLETDGDSSPAHFSCCRCSSSDGASSVSGELLGSPVFDGHGKRFLGANFSRTRGRSSRLRRCSQISGSADSGLSSSQTSQSSFWEQRFFPLHADYSSSWDGSRLSLEGDFASTAVPYSYVQEEELLEPISEITFTVRRSPRRMQWWASFLLSCRSCLDEARKDARVSQKFSKAFMLSRQSTSLSGIAVPLVSRFSRSKTEVSAWLQHMGGNYGTPLLLALVVGYWIQGFRSFPWLAVCFHLKDGLRVDPATLQFIQSTVNLPMVAKPIYGIISDAVYIGGARRMPYLVIAGVLQTLSWCIAALHLGVRSSVGGMIGVLVVSNIGAAIAEVVNDALVAESGQKERGRSKGELQSFMFLALACGGVLGNLSGGLALSRLSANSMFAVFTALVAVHLVTCALVKERSFGFNVTTQSKIPEEEKVSIFEIVSKQAKKLMLLVGRPEILMPLLWFASSYAVIPAMGGSLFFFQTQHLRISPTSLGFAKVIGQMGLFVASLLYNRFLKKTSPRRVLMWTQILLSLCMLCDLLLVSRVNIKLGIPDHIFVLGASAFVEAIAQFKILPVVVLLTQLCPAGSEASLLAFSMSCHCLATIASGYLGVGLSSVLRLSADSFSGLPMGLVLQSLAALMPLLWLSCIPGESSKPRIALGVS